MSSRGRDGDGDDGLGALDAFASCDDFVIGLILSVRIFQGYHSSSPANGISLLLFIGLWRGGDGGRTHV